MFLNLQMNAVSRWTSTDTSVKGIVVGSRYFVVGPIKRSRGIAMVKVPRTLHKNAIVLRLSENDILVLAEGINELAEKICCKRQTNF